MNNNLLKITFLLTQIIGISIVGASCSNNNNNTTSMIPHSFNINLETRLESNVSRTVLSYIENEGFSCLSDIEVDLNDGIEESGILDRLNTKEGGSMTTNKLREISTAIMQAVKSTRSAEPTIGKNNNTATISKIFYRNLYYVLGKNCMGFHYFSKIVEIISNAFDCLNYYELNNIELDISSWEETNESIIFDCLKNFSQIEKQKIYRSIALAIKLSKKIPDSFFKNLALNLQVCYNFDYCNDVIQSIRHNFNNLGDVQRDLDGFINQKHSAILDSLIKNHYIFDQKSKQELYKIINNLLPIERAEYPYVYLFERVLNKNSCKKLFGKIPQFTKVEDVGMVYYDRIGDILCINNLSPTFGHLIYLYLNDKYSELNPNNYQSLLRTYSRKGCNKNSIPTSCFEASKLFKNNYCYKNSDIAIEFLRKEKCLSTLEGKKDLLKRIDFNFPDNQNRSITSTCYELLCPLLYAGSHLYRQPFLGILDKILWDIEYDNWNGVITSNAYVRSSKSITHNAHTIASIEKEMKAKNIKYFLLPAPCTLVDSMNAIAKIKYELEYSYSTIEIKFYAHDELEISLNTMSKKKGSLCEEVTYNKSKRVRICDMRDDKSAYILDRALYSLAKAGINKFNLKIPMPILDNMKGDCCLNFFIKRNTKHSTEANCNLYALVKIGGNTILFRESFDGRSIRLAGISTSICSRTIIGSSVIYKYNISKQGKNTLNSSSSNNHSNNIFLECEVLKNHCENSENSFSSNNYYILKSIMIKGFSSLERNMIFDNKNRDVYFLTQEHMRDLIPRNTSKRVKYPIVKNYIEGLREEGRNYNSPPPITLDIDLQPRNNNERFLLKFATAHKRCLEINIDNFVGVLSNPFCLELPNSYYGSPINYCEQTYTDDSKSRSDFLTINPIPNIHSNYGAKLKILIKQINAFILSNSLISDREKAIFFSKYINIEKQFFSKHIF